MKRLLLLERHHALSQADGLECVFARYLKKREKSPGAAKQLHNDPGEMHKTERIGVVWNSPDCAGFFRLEKEGVRYAPIYHGCVQESKIRRSGNCG